MKYLIEQCEDSIKYWQGQKKAFGIPLTVMDPGYNSYTAKKDEEYGHNCDMRIMHEKRQIARLKAEYDPEPMETAEAMINRGGSFMCGLGHLWMRGDDNNRNRIQTTWADEWAEYKEHAKREATK